MNTKQAIEILVIYNKWRRGNCKVDLPYPEVIGKAIDIVLRRMEKITKEKKK